MRFHLISLPHTQTTNDYSACAFTEKVRNFAKMMMGRGHEIFLYAGEYNDVPCTKYYICITEQERQKHVGDGHYTHASFDYNLPAWQNFNQRAIDVIRDVAEPTDFIISFGGLAHKQIADALPHLMFVEAGIGYGGNWAKYRIWESYAWMHTCYGAQSNGNANSIDGIWYDAVIPGYFDIERFPFSEEKEDYLFFIGRLTERKGYQIAIDVAKKLGKRIVVAGQPDPGSNPPDNCEYLGVIGPEERGQWMAKAQATFMPTIYLEPFGNVAVESMASGTPVITTDWGAMTETVIEGVTGYHCRMFREFCEAVDKCQYLDPWVIRKHAYDNYSFSAIAPKYEAHFERLLTLHGDGWYSK